MKLSDLRDWIEQSLSSLALGADIEYVVGRYVASSTDKILISIKQFSGSLRPPFLRYNRYRIHVISNQIFLQSETGDAFSEDMDSLLGQVGIKEGAKTQTPVVANDDGLWEEGESIADSIELASNGEPPCGVVGIKLLGGKTGPLYLEDGRLYYTLDLEIII